MHQWPAIATETLPWRRDPAELALVPKSCRRRIGSTYEAALPLLIADRPITVTDELATRITDAITSLVRFDERQAARGYDLPALLLRSESASSSQIENLTSSVRNVALAELTGKGPHNAQAISGNVLAMREALALPGGLSLDVILSVHQKLMEPTGQGFGGSLRDEQVWVGGSTYSPHGAAYVPPAAGRVQEYLEDLVRFSGRNDLNPVVKAAVIHAQFETIHPFIDGNGRCGRTLVHRSLRNDDILTQSTLPLSAGLLHDVDAYLASIRMYQAGDPLSVIEQLTSALERACMLGELVASRIDKVFESWGSRIQARAGSSILRLPQVLAEQPVVNSTYLARRMGITTRAANDLIQKAETIQILRPTGTARRGVSYQSDELIDVLEAISSEQGIRRVLASGRL